MQTKRQANEQTNIPTAKQADSQKDNGRTFRTDREEGHHSWVTDCMTCFYCEYYVDYEMRQH